MTIYWTETQRARLKALNAAAAELERGFKSCVERDRFFQRRERQITRAHRTRLANLRHGKRRPQLCLLAEQLAAVLTEKGFVQVTTPIIMSKNLIRKMSIDENHALNQQIFWLDAKRCLRPMLAPHLYFVLKDLLRLWEPPVSIFEIGPCFRKESQGARHANEFTMLNLVEMGLAEDRRMERLAALAQVVMETAGIPAFRLAAEGSDVYGETRDVLAGEPEIEVGSGAMGPHFLDQAWKINQTWVGIGFGLERLLMVAGGHPNLASVGRSLSYLDGIKLKI